MTPPRWPLTGSGTTVMVGTVLLALMTIFGFIGAVPWESKGSVAKFKADVVDPMKTDIHRELTEIKTDLRALVKMLRRNSHDETP